MTGHAGGFNEVAELYDEVRPGYPAEIVDAIAAEVPAGGRILEIGCGTGQITMPLAARGYAILALEPGDALAALAARKCRPRPRVDVVVTSFEAWPLEARAFDLVLAAQSFHWIAPEAGPAKAAAALRDGGGIALVWHLDTSQDTPFWQATLPIYDAYFGVPADDGGSLASKIRTYREALAGSPDFADLRERRHAWRHAYAGADYLKLLRTFSDHLALPEPRRTGFFRAIGEAIEREGGVVHRKYETVLLTARRALGAP